MDGQFEFYEILEDEQRKCEYILNPCIVGIYTNAFGETKKSVFDVTGDERRRIIEDVFEHFRRIQGKFGI